MHLKIQSISLAKGKKKILNNINISITDSEIVCLSGQNGAGKSSFFRTILGMESGVHGDVTFDNISMLSNERFTALRRIGALLFNDTYYSYLSGRKNLEIIGSYYDNVKFAEVEKAAQIVGLSDVLDQQVKTYSSGMKQRLLVAMSIIHSPDLLILDEPFNSIDQENTKHLINIIKKINKTMGVTVIVSSHSIIDLESLYTRFVVIKNGEIVFDQNKSQIQNLYISDSLTTEFEKEEAIFRKDNRRMFIRTNDNTLHKYETSTISLQNIYELINS